MLNAKLYDVAIVGAGPGGSVAALGLARAGHSVLLIDKTEFPRHKVCGDAIPNNAMRLLQREFPDVEKAIREQSAQPINGYRAYWKGLRIASGTWTMQAVNAARASFDHTLLLAALKEPNCHLAAPHRIVSVQRQPTKSWIVSDAHGQQFQARAIILAHGANGDFRTQLGLDHLDKSQWGVAGSEYRTNWSSPPTRNLFFIPKGLSLPGYFWIFPTGDDRCNVGFGVISDKPVKLKSLYQEVCSKDPKIAQFLKGTNPKSVFQGHKIPIPQRPIACSAPGALLIGDATELVDPLFGHGIDKAMISGFWAAQALIQGFESGNLECFRAYEQRIHKTLYPEMLKNFKRMRTLTKVLQWL